MGRVGPVGGWAGSGVGSGRVSSLRVGSALPGRACMVRPGSNCLTPPRLLSAGLDPSRAETTPYSLRTQQYPARRDSRDSIRHVLRPNPTSPPARFVPTSTGTARPAETDATRPGPSRPDATRPDPDRLDPTRPEPTRLHPTRPASDPIPAEARRVGAARRRYGAIEVVPYR